MSMKMKMSAILLLGVLGIAGVAYAQSGAGIQSGRAGSLPCTTGRTANGACIEAPDQPADIKISPVCETNSSISKIPFHRFNQLTWSVVPGATSYKIYRATVQDGDWKFLKEVAGTPLLTMFQDGPFPSPGINTDWYYTVTAVVSGAPYQTTVNCVPHAYQGESLREAYVFQE